MILSTETQLKIDPKRKMRNTWYSFQIQTINKKAAILFFG